MSSKRRLFHTDFRMGSLMVKMYMLVYDRAMRLMDRARLV